MYRDDLQALAVTLDALEAELRTARRQRRQAEAERRQAFTARDRARRIALDIERGAPRALRLWLRVLAVVLALAIGVGLFIWTRARHELALAAEEEMAATASLRLAVEARAAERAAVSRRQCRSRPPRSTEPLPSALDATTLSRQDIQAGMRRIRHLVQACHDRFRLPGLAAVQVTIGSSGHPHAARTVGTFAGTPTGRCIEDAVTTARFPSFSGQPLTVQYPFVLR